MELRRFQNKIEFLWARKTHKIHNSLWRTSVTERTLKRWVWSILKTLPSCRVSRHYLQNSVQYVLMFVIYSQAAPHKHKNPTVDSIRETCSINILNLSTKIKFHTFWAHIASIFDGFVVLLRLSNLLLLFFSIPYSLRSPLNWFIKQSKDGDSKRRRPTNRFRFPKYRIAIGPGVFPLSPSLLSVT